MGATRKRSSAAAGTASVVARECHTLCTRAPASPRSSVATEWVLGRSIDDVLTIKNTEIAAHLKLPPVKLHCSMLAEDAIKAAVRDYAKKNNLEVAGGATAAAPTAAVAAIAGGTAAKMTA